MYNAECLSGANSLCIATAGNATESMNLTVTEGSSYKSADAEDDVETEVPKQKNKRGKRKENVVKF